MSRSSRTPALTTLFESDDFLAEAVHRLRQTGHEIGIIGFYERAGNRSGLPEFAAARAEHRATIESVLKDRRANLEAFEWALAVVKKSDE